MRYLPVILMLCFCGCTLFQKTKKESAVHTQRVTDQLEWSQLVLKSEGKETQIFTYWNDSAFYQYQQIREHTDQAKTGSLKTEKDQQMKTVIKEKKKAPYAIWIYLVLIVTGLITFYLVRKKRF